MDSIKNHYVISNNIYTSKKTNIYKAVRITDKQPVIIKHISMRNYDTAMNELNNLRRCIGKKHIIQYIDNYNDVNGIYIIMEQGECDLSVYIGKLTIIKLKRVIKDILLGLIELKSINLCHCDLKEKNIIIKNHKYKLCDLGNSEMCTANSILIKHNGTPMYMSPEHINHYYNYQTDMWALGVLIYHLTTGLYPWKLEKDINTEFKNILEVEPVINRDIITDDKIYDFIKLCLHRNPKERISCEEALKIFK